MCSLLLVLTLSTTSFNLPAVADGDKDGFKLSKEEQAILDLTNEQRKKADLPPLKADEKLCKAARAQSANMARQEKVEHNLDGKDLAQRIKEVEYAHAGCGENCASGQRTAKEVMRGWMNSETHRKNILHQDYTEIGIGIGISQRGERYYTQIFARPQ